MLINQMPGLALDTTTATAGKIFNGYTAYNGDGELITGTAMATSITGVASDVLNGKTVYNQNGEVVTGNMTNNGSYTATTSYGGSTTIPAGYHNGSGYITGGSFNFSGATATADKILSGYTAYGSSGSLLTGTASAGKRFAFATFSNINNRTITFNYLSFQPINYVVTSDRTGSINCSVPIFVSHYHLTGSQSGQGVKSSGDYYTYFSTSSNFSSTYVNSSLSITIPDNWMLYSNGGYTLFYWD